MNGMEHGTVQCTDANYFKSKCLFRCNEGYKMAGPSVLNCLSSSEFGTHDWDRPAPACLSEWTFAFCV